MQNVLGALENSLAVSYKPVGALATCLALYPIYSHAMTSLQDYKFQAP